MESRMFNVGEVRKQFPVLEQCVNGSPLVYLDNAATTQMPRCVMESLQEQYACYNANVHRGIHYLSNRSTERMEEARRIVRSFLNAASEKEIIFTSGTTEGLNMLAYSLGEHLIQPGDEILVSEMEHHANLVPWQMLCERKQAKLKIIPMDENGNLVWDAFCESMTEKTKILAFCHVSNVLGTVNPVKEMVRAAHERGIVTVVDGAQGIAREPVDVQDMECDFYCFSGHKIYAPMGVGVVYGRQEWLEKLPPYKFGGEMVNQVTLSHTTFAGLPYKFEAGTPNVAGIIALGRALQYVEELGREEIQRYEQELLDFAYAQLCGMDGIKIVGEPVRRTGVISFVVKQVHPFDTAMFLSELGVAVRSGHHCAQTVMQHFELDASVRVAPAFYNTKEEIGVLCDGLRKMQAFFGRRM